MYIYVCLSHHRPIAEKVLIAVDDKKTVRLIGALTWQASSCLAKKGAQPNVWRIVASAFQFESVPFACVNACYRARYPYAGRVHEFTRRQLFTSAGKISPIARSTSRLPRSYLNAIFRWITAARNMPQLRR